VRGAAPGAAPGIATTSPQLGSATRERSTATAKVVHPCMSASVVCGADAGAADSGSEDTYDDSFWEELDKVEASIAARGTGQGKNETGLQQQQQQQQGFVLQGQKQQCQSGTKLGQQQQQPPSPSAEPGPQATRADTSGVRIGK